MGSPEMKEKIWNYIKDIQIAMVVTDNDGDLRARPMALVQDDYDGTLWFFTKHDAAKVDEVQKDKHVCVAFSDHDNNVHVSMSGTANITKDQNLIDTMWNPIVAAWFPEGKDHPNVALLEIKVHKGKYWDSDKNPITFFYEIAKANVKDEHPDMGENRKFG
jgi:general stress protein 26